jgi:hypothetical protein
MEDLVVAAGVIVVEVLVVADLEASAAVALVAVELAEAGKHIKKGVQLDSFLFAHHFLIT